MGKTSLATATAISLADANKKVLLVSTDAASNLDQMLGVELRNSAVAVPDVPNLWIINIDPNDAAESYRQRVLAQMAANSSVDELATVREQLSGACTTEIAAFDEFTALLSSDSAHYDHIVFDTAPTGHTLRLLSLPKAWTGFLAGNDRGASCLGPHSGLKMQEARFKTALDALSDSSQTSVVLVTRPDKSAIAEAARTTTELKLLGFDNQRLVVNGVFHASDRNDAIAQSIETLGAQAIAEMPATLRALPTDQIPLRAFDTVGVKALRALFRPEQNPDAGQKHTIKMNSDERELAQLVDELAAAGKGLIMVMGKGGVGKTTIAAALAIGLVQRGQSVHLSTTDPAAHLAMTIAGELRDLQVSRIDPKVETERYVEKIMAARSSELDAEAQALLREDLRSPCTEEVAVFHAFSRIVSEARSAFVVLDTAPTGHSLLLIDATGAYHRQIMHSVDTSSSMRVITPLMRLQDPDYTRVILVTLPETTPVTQAAELQDDLRRAHIEPYAWVVNKSIHATGTHDPLLLARLTVESAQMERIHHGLASRIFVVPWRAQAPIGIDELAQLVAE
ncbi:MAG TPA: arsenical pump-driving ATPase, partial [Spongiibacteraceae bacterium]|nr:arsenical pump-driving ATPase [Spongiibacteraceae bacterium]